MNDFVARSQSFLIVCIIVFLYSLFSSSAPQGCKCAQQEAQLSPSDRAMRLVSSNLANYHATVQKILIRRVLTKPMV